MENLITDYNAAFEATGKADYLKKYYSGENDILLGLVECSEEGEVSANEVITKFLKSERSEGWQKGDVVNGKEVDFISRRIDLIQDFDMPDYLQQIKAPNVYETIEQMEARTGKKCTGTKKTYYTVCICRRFKNPLNGIYTYDDEINGATAVKLSN